MNKGLGLSFTVRRASMKRVLGKLWLHAKSDFQLRILSGRRINRAARLSRRETSRRRPSADDRLIEGKASDVPLPALRDLQHPLHLGMREHVFGVTGMALPG